MNKTEFIVAIESKTGLSKNDSNLAVNTVLEIITNTLVKGDSIFFNGFGTFLTSTRAERNGINPFTRATLKIPATTVVKFRVAKALKEAIAK